MTVVSCLASRDIQLLSAQPAVTWSDDYVSISVTFPMCSRDNAMSSSVR